MSWRESFPLLAATMRLATTGRGIRVPVRQCRTARRLTPNSAAVLASPSSVINSTNGPRALMRGEFRPYRPKVKRLLGQYGCSV